MKIKKILIGLAGLMSLSLVACGTENGGNLIPDVPSQAKDLNIVHVKAASMNVTKNASRPSIISKDLESKNDNLSFAFISSVEPKDPLGIRDASVDLSTGFDNVKAYVPLMTQDGNLEDALKECPLDFMDRGINLLSRYSLTFSSTEANKNLVFDGTSSNYKSDDQAEILKALRLGIRSESSWCVVSPFKELTTNDTYVGKKDNNIETLNYKTENIGNNSKIQLGNFSNSKVDVDLYYWLEGTDRACSNMNAFSKEKIEMNLNFYLE